MFSVELQLPPGKTSTPELHSSTQLGLGADRDLEPYEQHNLNTPKFRRDRSPKVRTLTPIVRIPLHDTTSGLEHGNKRWSTNLAVSRIIAQYTIKV